MEVTMNKMIWCIGLVMLFAGCDKDDYNKNEFRYTVQGVRLSTPDDGFRIFTESPVYMKWTDSTKKGLEIYSYIMLHDKFYNLKIEIDSLTGKGIYRYPEVKAHIKLSEINTTYYSAYSRINLHGELNLNYINPLNGAAGYFHFLCEDTVRNIRVPVTNGRFNLGWSTER